MLTPRAAAGRMYRSYRLRHGLLNQPLSVLPSSAEVYRGLVPTALLFDRVVMTERSVGVSLLLPTIGGSLSAGPMTALRFAAMVATALRRPLRVFTVNLWQKDDEGQQRKLERLIGMPMEVHHVGSGRVGRVGRASPSDLWIATSWETAAAADVARRCERIMPGRVVYLIQDYEPAFSAWSTSWAVAQATYHAGFHLVVNSMPLARYLREQEGIEVRDEYVAAPDLDLSRLRSVAEARQKGPLRVFFYARPGSYRNMYGLGVAAARRAAALAGSDWSLVLAGESIRPPEIQGVDVLCLGRTDINGYYEMMSTTSVALSLMMSPHPSHPPLDWAISGGWAVTNTFGKFRDQLHQRLLTARADADALGQLLARTIDETEVGSFLEPSAPLGRPIRDVVESLVAEVAFD
jgi:hypothetical protein